MAGPRRRSTSPWASVGWPPVPTRVSSAPARDVDGEGGPPDFPLHCSDYGDLVRVPKDSAIGSLLALTPQSPQPHREGSEALNRMVFVGERTDWPGLGKCPAALGGWRLERRDPDRVCFGRMRP